MIKMKKLALVVFIIIPCFTFGQTDNQGTLSVRKNSPLHAYTSIAGITKGQIHIKKLKLNPNLDLNSNKPGKILSYEIGFTTKSQEYKAIRIIGSKIPNKFIELIEENKPSKFYIEKIIAIIEGEEIRLPMFSLKIIY